jgi:hypothetical protein
LSKGGDFDIIESYIICGGPLFMDVGSKIKKIYNKAVSWGSKKGLLVAMVTVLSLATTTFVYAKDDKARSWFISSITWFLERIMAGFQTVATVFISLVLTVGSYNDFINIAPVVNAWVVVRDLTNIAIILAVIVVAFGTIFGVNRFGDIKSLPKILIAGVLINFSRTIVGFLIDGSQLIMSAFMQGLSAVAAAGLVDTLGLLKYTKLNADVDGAAHMVAKIFMEMFVSMGFIILTIAVLGVILLTLIFRIVTFWLVVATSPAAFLAAVLPGTKGMFNEWRKYLVNNLLNGPLLAFFLWLSISIMASMEQIIRSTGVVDASGQGVTEFFRGTNILTTLIGVALLILSLGFASSLAAVGAKSIENWGKNYFVNRPLSPLKKLAGINRGAAAWKAAKFTGKALGKPFELADKAILGGQGREWRQGKVRAAEDFFINKPKTYFTEKAAQWSLHTGLYGKIRGWDKDPQVIQKKLDDQKLELEQVEAKREFATARSAQKLVGDKLKQAEGNPTDFSMSEPDFNTLVGMLRLSGEQGQEILGELKDELQAMRSNAEYGISEKASDAEVMGQLLSNSAFQTQRDRFQNQISDLNQSAATRFEGVDDAVFTSDEQRLLDGGDYNGVFDAFAGDNLKEEDAKRERIKNLQSKVEEITKRQARGAVSEGYLKNTKHEAIRQAERLKPIKEELANLQLDSVDEMATAYFGFHQAGKKGHMKALLEQVNDKGLIAKFADTLNGMHSGLFAGNTNEDRVLTVMARAYMDDGYFNEDGLNKSKLEANKPRTWVQFANDIEKVSKKAESTGDLHLTGMVTAQYGQYKLAEQGDQNKKVLELLRAGKAKSEDLHRIILDKDGNLNDVGRQYLEQAGTTLAARIKSGRIENQDVIDAVHKYLFDDEMSTAIEEGFMPANEMEGVITMSAKVRNNLLQVKDVLNKQFSGDGAEAIIAQIEKEKEALDREISRNKANKNQIEKAILKIRDAFKNGSLEEDDAKGQIQALYATIDTFDVQVQRLIEKREKKVSILQRHHEHKAGGQNSSASQVSSPSFAELKDQVIQLGRDFASTYNQQDQVAFVRDLQSQLVKAQKEIEQLENLEEQEQMSRGVESLQERLEKFIQDRGGENAQ